MSWQRHLGNVAAGSLLANGVPHFQAGVSGRLFPTPFASPPGVGDSPPLVNVAWGGANLVAGWALLRWVTRFRRDDPADVLMASAGALIMAVFLGRHFARVRAE